MVDKVFLVTGNKISTLLIDENSLKFSSSTSTTVEKFKEAFAKKLSLTTKVEIKYDAIKSIKKEDNDKDILIKYRTFVAIQSLKEREGIKKDDLIHSAKATDTDKSAVKSTIIQWLKSKDIDAAIWTGLSFSDKTNKTRPTLEYVLNHLRTLEYIKRRTAEEYIRKAPKQIDTEFRRKIEVEFGWTPIE